jgi:hypothetical protein
MSRIAPRLLFLAALATLPWLAYELLALLVERALAWRFVAECLWVGTPVLVLVAGLRGYGEGLEAGRKQGRTDRSDRPADASSTAAPLRATSTFQPSTHQSKA